MTTLKFYYNGIRASDSKLQRCNYYMGKLIDYPNKTNVIMITAQDYMLFSKAVCAVFDVLDDSHAYSDYCSKQYIYVEPDHPLYAQVLVAYKRGIERDHQQAAMQLIKARAYHAKRAAQ